MSDLKRNSAEIAEELVKTNNFIGLIIENSTNNPKHGLYGADHSDISALANESTKSAQLFSRLATGNTLKSSL